MDFLDWKSCTTPVPVSGGTINDVVQISCLQVVFARIINVVAALSGLAFLIMLLFGGFKYLTAGADPKAAESAKGTLTAAFLGLFLIIAAYLILRLLSVFTGLDLTKFQITNFNQ